MLLDEAGEPLRSESLNRRRTAQSARLPQISPISLISLLYATSLYAFFQQGFVSGTTFVAVAAVAIALVGMFYGAFRSGLNTRFRDQTLMLPQIVASLLMMLCVAWIERDTQVALVPFILIAFSFGIFRLSTLSLIALAVGCLAAYLGIILLRYHEHGHGFALRADMMQWFVLALTLPGMILVGKQIQTLRQLLSATRYQLEHYEEKSVRDDLTGLYNRRQLQTELEQARLEANAGVAPFSMCLIDIDRFKEINDGNGHLAGDTILKEFSRLARNSIRDSDVLGRYGGDEFLLILKDTDLKGAVMHAERLRVYAHFLDFQKVLAQKHISLSIGVAQYRKGEKITDLISRADSALYQAKQLGRNRVEWREE
ncbi:MAG TPA: GGDEF domain-containing protein [Noviherbaspirillum sp.]|jgi:diguanylate cyclase (GGDEF)-like protein